MLFATAKLRLRQSVGIVTSSNQIEFFRANTRTSLSLKMNPEGVVELLQDFNGRNKIRDICKKYNSTKPDHIKQFAEMLHRHYVLIDHNAEYSVAQKTEKYRVINLLEDFFHSTKDVIEALRKISEAKVVLIGLGAVGSYISLYLAKMGVQNFILIDPDVVDLSNLHRQSFSERDVGSYKSLVMKDRILRISPVASVVVIKAQLDEMLFARAEFEGRLNLIINCADEPSVDYTSKIVSRYAMMKRIPHIVGGGYNLHLTLIGQTIIPFETACYKCFETALDEMNKVEFRNLKRLNRRYRKLGSFSPLSGMAASLAALDSLKLLAGASGFLQQSNKRIEFDLKSWKFKIIEIKRNPSCLWCGCNCGEILDLNENDKAIT